jgi:hypothetical protein
MVEQRINNARVRYWIFNSLKGKRSPNEPVGNGDRFSMTADDKCAIVITRVHAHAVITIRWRLLGEFNARRCDKPFY